MTVVLVNPAGDDSIDNNLRRCIGIDNKIFPATFTILKFAGFWEPTTIKYESLRILYKFYTVFSLLGVIMLNVTIFLDIAFTENKSMMAVMEYWYMIIIFANGAMKASNILIRRARIMDLLENSIIHERWSVLRDDEERSMIKESEKSERFVTLFWFYLLVINGISSALNPIVRDNPENTLMWDSYSPCDRSGRICFWLSYIYQCYGYGISSIVHVGCDAIILNFIDRVCAHLKIFQHRLKKLPIILESKIYGNLSDVGFEKNYMKECIKDHHSIIKTAANLTKTFNEIVFIQFLSSISVLCTNIYFLSKQELFSPEFIAVSVYFCCALTQNFVYCWYGYKITENSNDCIYTIFTMNWLILRKETKKMLIIMMISVSEGIKLFNNSIVNLTPETFLKITKMSYSAFNLLQQSQKK